ncbi:MAG TPA: sulfatase-like hydrolase/transferase, partial [Thermoanaerobaculia bacterium]|nr:sulfatase-like hydrolase/transferase [Thermoanaerobaculia bacterium]
EVRSRNPSPLSFCLLSALFLTACGDRPERAPGAPVVLISIDTLRSDRLPAYGYRAGATPAIDRLAADGILFESAWAQVPLTLPSHASLFTGLLPPAVGVRSNLGYRLEPGRGTPLAAALAGHGYATGGAVSAYVLRRETGIAAGFESYDDAIAFSPEATLSELERTGERTVDAALAWLGGVADRPFFLFLHLFEPHFPYEPPSPFRERLADPYDGEIATADAAVGRLLDWLSDRGLYEKAVIVLVSDHGEGLGDHGEQEHGILLYRESLQVPLIVKLPGQRRAGERVERPVGLIDVAPTLYELLDVPPPAGLEGRSLLAPAMGEEASRAIYAETVYPRIHLGWSELRTMVDGRWQYIEGPDPELYDLAKDPGQRENVLTRERREYRRLADRLAEIPLALEAAREASAEERAKLAALGYLAGSAPETSGPRPDPKREIALLEELQGAFRLANTGELPRALAALEGILARQPALVDARLQRAAVLRRLGRPLEAKEEYLRVARESEPHRESVALEVAKLELELGEIAAAEEHARLALAATPAEARLLLAAAA